MRTHRTLWIVALLALLLIAAEANISDGGRRVVKRQITIQLPDEKNPPPPDKNQQNPDKNQPPANGNAGNAGNTGNNGNAGGGANGGGGGGTGTGGGGGG
ncbi:uncharacterized protein VTP21DRAFT_3088, partial [Calcarisporiella thermophila]|uniref:uncharacterized protein n=1 Tax=Calcarisporiella thermophila TaxID=911321 RepID=UPI003743F751